MATRDAERDLVAALIAISEDRFPVPLLDDAGIRALLRSRPRIALVGASSNPARPSHGVMRSLRRRATTSSRSTRARPRSTGSRATRRVADAVAATGPVDIVDVFRRRGPVRRARARGGRRRRAVPVAPAGDRQRGGGPDRARRRAGGRHGPLHDRRAPAPRGGLTRGSPRHTGPTPRASPDRAHPEDPMPQIHLHAEPGDYAPVVLLPGDPNRATRIAARFDGGVEGSRLVTSHRGLLGYTGTVDGVPVSVQTTMMGAPTTSIVVEELLMLGVTTFIRVGTTGGYGAHGDRRRRRRHGGGGVHGRRRRPRRRRGRPPRPPSLDVVLALAEASRALGLTTHVGPVVTGDVFYDPRPAARAAGAAAATCRPRWRPRPSTCSRCASGQGPAGPGGLHPDGVGRDLRPGRRRGDPRGRLGDVVPAARGRGHPAGRPDDRRRARGRRGARPGLRAGRRRLRPDRASDEGQAELEVGEQVLDVLAAHRDADSPSRFGCG